MKRLLIWQSSSVIIGTVIGAGILGLPYAFIQSGFLTGLLVLCFISACMIMLSLFFGEVMLRTKEKHQLTGYTGLYLGRGAKHLQALLMFFGMFSALLAYTIGLGEILANIIGGEAIAWSIASYAILAFFVFKGLGIIKRIEFVIGFLIIGLLFAIALLAAPHMDTSAWSNFSWNSFFIPYGAILFACTGLVSLPEAREILAAGKGERFLKTSILIGNIVPALIYIIFAAIVVAVSGAQTTQIATIGLSAVIGPTALLIGGLFSIIAMSSSFLTLGTALREVFEYDYGLKPLTAITLTLIVPAFLFAIGFRDFFGIVSISGALSVGLSGLLTLTMFWRAKKLGTRKPEYSLAIWFAAPATFILAAAFIAGIIYTL